MPTNLYGPNQRYEPMNSLVVPALINKFHQAKMSEKSAVVIWGSGRPARDLLYVDDLAEASIFLMKNYEGNVLLNVGTGKSYTITKLAKIIKKVVGYKGDIIYDASLPDGVRNKLQDVSTINDLGWKHQVELEQGICLTYQDFLARIKSVELI